MIRSNRRFHILIIMLVLLGELLDPSTSFIRAGVKVPILIVDHWSHDEDESAASRDVAVQTDDSESEKTSRSTLETDQVHYACVVSITCYEFLPISTTVFVPALTHVPDGPLDSILQPPEAA